MSRKPENKPKPGTTGGHQRLRLENLDMVAYQSEDKAAYEKELSRLQERILHVQQAYWHNRHRAIIVFEGWDAAGKGGAIRRLTERLDPRGAHVWPISAPSTEDQGKHYLYRFWQRLPALGTFAIFDRSWYGRVLVERVEGMVPPDTWQRAYREIEEFERLLTDDGVRVIKLFLHITPEEQLKRFTERLTNPYKRWKLTEEDLRNRDRWDDYVTAAEEMFHHTSTPNARWHLIPANAKWHARVAILRTVIAELERGVDVRPPPLDPAVQKAAAERLGIKL